MKGFIGKKIGMTAVYNQAGHRIACTIIEAGPCTVTQQRTQVTDGYEAIQLGYQEKKEKNTTRPLQGHFKKAGTTPKKTLVEFKNFVQDCPELKLTPGETITINYLYKENEYTDIIANAKGKGFQGVVKRHNFSGVGDATHGQHNRARSPGAIGACATPSLVFKGTRMPGRMGGHRVKIKNLQIIRIIPEKNLILVAGPIPGPPNGRVILLSSK